MFIDKIEKEALIKPLQITGGIIERKQPLPILSNVLIQKSGSKFKFVSTDLEIQITTVMATDQSPSEEAITVAGKKLQEILRVLPDDSKVSLEIQDSKLQIKAGKSKFNLQTLPAGDFPQVADQLKEAEKIQVKQNSFKQLLGSVQYAMAQQDIRYYLNGVLLVIEGNMLKAVATDGHRLAYSSIELAGNFAKREIIVPRKTIAELTKLLTDTEEEITLEVGETQVRMAFSDVNITSKVIDGKFPDYAKVIPSHANHVVLERLPVLQALQRVAILSNEKFRGVRLVLTEKNLRIVSSNSEQEEAQEDMETDYHGPGLDVGFNVNYLLDGLNNIASQNVVFSFGDPNSSVLLTKPDDANFKYVIMPMRI
jgi:DNA polymerase-3 subunit beta